MTNKDSKERGKILAKKTKLITSINKSKQISSYEDENNNIDIKINKINSMNTTVNINSPKSFLGKNMKFVE